MKVSATLLMGYLFGRKVVAKNQIKSSPPSSSTERCAQARLCEIEGMMDLLRAYSKEMEGDCPKPFWKTEF